MSADRTHESATETPAASWHGWIYQSGYWRRACAGDSKSACAKLLSYACDLAELPDRFAGMTGGAAPTWTPAES